MNNRLTNLDMGDIIAKGMIPVVRKRNIVKVRIPTREELKGVGQTNIVYGTTPSGVNVVIHRKDLVDNYTYLNGASIKLAGLESGKEYLVIKSDNTPAFAMLVPLNCTVTVNGRRANASRKKTGDYIVAGKAESGLPDTSDMGIISATMFRKMYHIPPNEIIDRHRNSGNKLFRNNGEEYRSDRDMAADMLENVMQNAMVSGGIGSRQPDRIRNHDGARQTDGVSLNEKIIKHVKSNVISQENIQDAYRYIATGRLLDSNNQLVGFVIQSINGGEAKNININQMMLLCKDRKVSNIKLSRREDTGKYYLSGNNIRISMLPYYNINA